MVAEFFQHTVNDPMKHLFCVLSIALVGTAAAADPPEIPTGKKRAEFDLASFKTFIDRELSRPKPACSMADMGIPGRTVEGQLVDHQGKPIEGVVVAISEPIGYSGRCYYDNFDVTDDLGRFIVDGAACKTRLIFRKPSGRIWKRNLRSDSGPIRVEWPEPSKVTIQVPSQLAAAGQTIRIQTTQYWSGMATMRHSAELDDDGLATFDDVIPGDYFVTINKSLNVAGGEKTVSIDLARFSVSAGQQKTVKCDQGKTSIRGSVAVKPNAFAGNQRTFVIISRNKQSYRDVPPAGDLLNLHEDGSFRSRPLSPGRYTVKVIAKGLGPRRSFSGGDRTIRSWRVHVDGTQDWIDVDAMPDPDPVATAVDRALESTIYASGSSRGKSAAEQLKKLPNRDAAEKELLRRLSDPTYPYEKRSNIPYVLQSMTDSPQIIDGILRALQRPIKRAPEGLASLSDRREQASVMRSLQNATQMVRKITQTLAERANDRDHIVRGITIRVLGELAVKNPDHAGEIAKLLERGLSDVVETNRLTSADYLGRIGSTNSLPALLAARSDVYGPVAVMAALAAWKISGDPEDVYPTMTEVLHRDGLAGLWEAAYFMKSVAEEHPVPESTQGMLRRVATMAGKPPFRSSFEYEQSRAANAAQSLLDQIAQQEKKKK